MGAASSRLELMEEGEARAADMSGDRVVALPPMHPSLLVRLRSERCTLGPGEEVAVLAVLALPPRLPLALKLLRLVLADEGDEVAVACSEELKLELERDGVEMRKDRVSEATVVPLQREEGGKIMLEPKEGACWRPVAVAAGDAK